MINSSCELSKATTMHQTCFIQLWENSPHYLYIDNDSTKYWWMSVTLVFEENVCVCVCLQIYFLPPNYRSNDALDLKIFFFNCLEKDNFLLITLQNVHVPIFTRYQSLKIIRCSSIRHWDRKFIKRYPILVGKTVFSALKFHFNWYKQRFVKKIRYKSCVSQ